MLISFAMICSCQKQDSAAERQLAHRKAELDAREKALDEREKALAEREKALVSPRTIAPDLRSRVPVRDPAQVKAETDRRLQQLPPEVKQLLPDASQAQAARAEREKKIQELLGQRQRSLDQSKGMKTNPANQKAMSGAAAPPAAAGTTSPPPLALYPLSEAASPTPSPTPPPPTPQ